MRALRRDDPSLDLVEHARAVVSGRADLSPQARRLMVDEIGIKPSPGASDVAVARNYLAARGEHP